jgi:glycosyltransferase involved in cell wall biosynthesis
MLEIYLYLSFFISTCYFLLVVILIIGWLIPNKIKIETDEEKFVSIIIPVRNEEYNIANCLSSLCKQTLSNLNFEIIVVDDHSTDNTMEVLRKFQQDTKLNMKTYSLPTDKTGKKEALEFGINQSNFPTIITTDADCEYSENWLKEIMCYHEKDKVKMMIMPVVYKYKAGFMQAFYRLDFLSLVASGISFTKLKFPFLSNGANLMFDKKLFFDLAGYDNNKQISTGDDVFLTLKFAQKYKNNIYGINDYNLVVHTNSPNNFKEFISQRVRWGSKTKHYPLKFKLLGMLIFLFNTSILTNMILLFIYPLFVEFFLIQFVTKCFLNFCFLFLVAFWWKMKKTLIYLPIVEILYPIYIIYSVLAGLFNTYTWKGRIHK